MKIAADELSLVNRSNNSPIKCVVRCLSIISSGIDQNRHAIGRIAIRWRCIRRASVTGVELGRNLTTWSNAYLRFCCLVRIEFRSCDRVSGVLSVRHENRSTAKASAAEPQIRRSDAPSREGETGAEETGPSQGQEMTAPGNPAPPQKPPFYLSFAGTITHPATNKFRNALMGIVAQGYSELTVLLSSPGGSVDDGFALYGLLRSLPLKLTMHNVGAIDSIANTVFLAAEKERRFCCPTSRFLLHDVLWTQAVNTMALPQVVEQGLLIKTMQTSIIELLKLRTSFTDEDFKTFNFFKDSAIIDPAFAKEKGIVQEVKEAKIPAGAAVANVEF
jgi:ATP-dependent Clp protease, protease subunit